MAGNTANGAPDGFATMLIDAIQDARAAAAKGKPASQLAESAWDKLQFDFPVLGQDELAALVEEYASGKRRAISTRFLDTLRDSAGAPMPVQPACTAGDAAADDAGTIQTATAAAGGDQPSVGTLVPLYQQLYAMAVVETLRSCLQAPEEAALEQLAELQQRPAEPPLVAEDSHLEQLLTAAAEANEEGLDEQAVLQHRASQQEDDDSTSYEPLDQPAAVQQQHHQAELATAAGATTWDAARCGGLPQQLAVLAGHLSYHSMADAEIWRRLRLMHRLAACLAAVRQHPRFLELEEVAQQMLRLATDRIVASPIELEAGLPAMLAALALTSGGSAGSTAVSSAAEHAVAAAAAAELALAATVALAAQLTSPTQRRWLWQEVHQQLLPLAAKQLEALQVALARQARGGTGAQAPPSISREQLYRLALPCQLVYFFVLQAPGAALVAGPGGGASRVQDAVLRGGLLRSLVLLFVQLAGQPGAEPLRCALLLTCAAAQPLVEWAAAVPGFVAAAAAGQLQPGGESQLHGALWQVLLGSGGTQLAVLLSDAESASTVPAVYQALQLMADMQAVSRRPQPLWDAGVDAALRGLSTVLREQYSKPRLEQQTPAAAPAALGDDGTSAKCDDHAGEGVEDAQDALKLGVGPQEQAELMAQRRAQQLQPACLKLIKDLVQRQVGGGGKLD